ncbi:MAG: hypothetical protein IJ848_02440 [Alphaproteobacteria bacterium]|nr:hypothetical protein [Alphaproteobacteria bacterium]
MKNKFLATLLCCTISNVSYTAEQCNHNKITQYVEEKCNQDSDFKNDLDGIIIKSEKNYNDICNFFDGDKNIPPASLVEESEAVLNDLLTLIGISHVGNKIFDSYKEDKDNIDTKKNKILNKYEELANELKIKYGYNCTSKKLKSLKELIKTNIESHTQFTNKLMEEMEPLAKMYSLECEHIIDYIDIYNRNVTETLELANNKNITDLAVKLSTLRSKFNEIESIIRDKDSQRASRYNAINYALHVNKAVITNMEKKIFALNNEINDLSMLLPVDVDYSDTEINKIKLQIIELKNKTQELIDNPTKSWGKYDELLFLYIGKVYKLKNYVQRLAQKIHDSQKAPININNC